VVYISIFLSIRSLSNLAVLYFSLKKPASLLYHHVAWFVIQSVTAEKKKKQACTALSLSRARALSLFVSLCISMLPLGMRHWTAECSPLTSLQSRVHYVHYMPCNTSKGSAFIAPSASHIKVDPKLKTIIVPPFEFAGEILRRKELNLLQTINEAVPQEPLQNISTLRQVSAAFLA